MGGTALALGYYRAPEATAAAFVPNPTNPCWPEPIYRTGDLGQYGAEGELYFRGRKDFQIKYQGHRIELEEIERAVAKVPGVERCICTFEEKRQRLSGFYLGTADPDQVRQTLAHQLPVTWCPRCSAPVRPFPSIRTEKGTGKPGWGGGRPHDRPATSPSAPSRNHAAVRL